MTTLAQGKALAHVFCEPITEGLWDRVFTDTCDDDLDIIWELYMDVPNEDLQKILINLADEFQDMYNKGQLELLLDQADHEIY